MLEPRLSAVWRRYDTSAGRGASRFLSGEATATVATTAVAARQPFKSYEDRQHEPNPTIRELEDRAPSTTPLPDTTAPLHSWPEVFPRSEQGRLLVRPTIRPNPIEVEARQPLELSKQVHILGSDVQGRYVTHALASCQALPPVRFFTHRKDLVKLWHRGGRRLLLHNGDEDIVATRARAEYAGRKHDDGTQAQEVSPKEDRGAISHLIVTVPAASALRSIHTILPRIRPSTVICFLQNGMGVAEAVNEKFFPDPVHRPLYVLGHMTHTLAPKEGEPFTVSEVHQGRLMLTAMGRNLTQSPIKYHPPSERNARLAHFLNLMASLPRLQAGGYTLEDMMVKKLRRLIVTSVLEPLTVVLACNYDKLLANPHATQMIDQLLGEMLAVVARLPELRGSPEIQYMVRRGDMRAHVYKRLRALKDGSSRMRYQTMRGHQTDVDYLNGYFVRRGREVGVRCPVNESVMVMVKAKHGQELARLRDEVSVERETLPYQ